jgi:hypothetical protein
MQARRRFCTDSRYARTRRLWEKLWGRGHVDGYTTTYTHGADVLTDATDWRSSHDDTHNRLQR